MARDGANVRFDKYLIRDFSGLVKAGEMMLVVVGPLYRMTRPFSTESNRFNYPRVVPALGAVPS